MVSSPVSTKHPDTSVVDVVEVVVVGGVVVVVVVVVGVVVDVVVVVVGGRVVVVVDDVVEVVVVGRVVVVVLDVVVVTGTVILNGSALDVPPPVGPGGLNTVTCAVPNDAMSVAGMDACNCVGPRNEVLRFAPFQRTTASTSKSVPCTVALHASPPSAALYV